MIVDVIGETERRIKALSPRSASDIRVAAGPVVGFSMGMETADKAIKAFLFGRMYRHDRVKRVMSEAESVLKDLFGHYVKSPSDMPPEWRDSLDADRHSRVRRVADYVAGMTDRYTLIEHARFFKTTPELM
jgi:dGTPase